MLPMNNLEKFKLAAALAALGVAGFFLVGFFRGGDGVSDAVFFYDLSEKKLFPAPRTAVPPIQGVNNAEKDGVRAVVISTTGDPKDKKSWKIAYLEKYSDELKAQMETSQREGTTRQMGRAEALGHRFVARAEQLRWLPMKSAEAEQVLNEWTTMGTNGTTPIVCSP
jgi:hypothetical protein